MSVNTLKGPIARKPSALRRTFDRARDDPAYQAFALLRVGFTRAADRDGHRQVLQHPR